MSQGDMGKERELQTLWENLCVGSQRTSERGLFDAIADTVGEWERL